MHEIRQMIGVCPQQDVLFDLLSVKEHLQFFAAVKVSCSNIEQVSQVDDIGLLGSISALPDERQYPRHL